MSVAGTFGAMAAILKTISWKSPDGILQGGSIVLFTLLTVGFVTNVIGIPRTITLHPGDIQLERPPHVYMLIDSDRRLRGLPFLELLNDVHLADIRNTDLRMAEDGKPLGTPFASYEDMIRTGGGLYLGRYDRLSFTTSDNSDPRSNHRTYTVALRVGFRWTLLAWLFGFIALLRAILIFRGWRGQSR
jgi:hypothetical protein